MIQPTKCTNWALPVSLRTHSNGFDLFSAADSSLPVNNSRHFIQKVQMWKFFANLCSVRNSNFENSHLQSRLSKRSICKVYTLYKRTGKMLLLKFWQVWLHNSRIPSLKSSLWVPTRFFQLASLHFLVQQLCPNDFDDFTKICLATKLDWFSGLFAMRCSILGSPYELLQF